MSQKISPPPQSDDELDAYYSQYSDVELEAAGHLSSPDDPAALEMKEKIRKMAEREIKRRQVNLSFQSPEVARLEAIAKKKHLPMSTMVKSWIMERAEKEG